MGVDCNRYVVTEADAGQRLDVWLSRCAEVSRSRVQSLIRMGAVVDGTGCVCRLPKSVVMPGSVYAMSIPAAAPAEPQPQAIDLAVVYEDRDVLVLNKPAGLVVHPAAGHADGTLVNALLHHCKDLQGIGGSLRPGIVHRLDKDTSGLLVVAKNERAMLHLANQFQMRQVHKTYLAITAGVPEKLSGRIETLIGRSRHDRKKMSTKPGASGKPAVSKYRVLDTVDDFALVEVRIETGRTHQIRVQMAHIGCPIAGDLVYGASRKARWSGIAPDLRQMLHAWQLAFAHPETGEQLHFVAAFPEDMRAFACACHLSLPCGGDDKNLQGDAFWH